MFDNAEIKRRFELNGRPIDRHGNFVYIGLDFYVSRVQFPLLAHYHLLSGMSDQDMMVALRDSDLSDFEAKYVLKSSKDFIRDVLGLDLEAIRQASIVMRDRMNNAEYFHSHTVADILVDLDQEIKFQKIAVRNQD